MPLFKEDATIGSVLAATALQTGTFIGENFWGKEIAGAAGFKDFATARQLKEIVPNFTEVFSKANFEAFFLGLHLASSAIHFQPDTATEHPSKFVRQVAKVSHYLDEEPEGNLQYAVQAVNRYTAPFLVHAAPDLVKASIPAVLDIFTAHENLPIDAAIISFAIFGTLHIIRDMTKIPAKIMEAKHTHTKAYRAAHRTRKVDNVVDDPDILSLGERHVNHLIKVGDRHVQAVEHIGSSGVISQENIAAAKHPLGLNDERSIPSQASPTAGIIKGLSITAKLGKKRPKNDPTDIPTFLKKR